ncbi:hypothetical protein ACJIZ3_008991 [Penstemon smallii]|uniref:DUF4216 domain-containing protein n=1 Tax=Penstemon smallii TaxID=265156 RepID=A0ABD3TC39_9LAMI
MEFSVFSNPGRRIGREDSIVLEKETIAKAHQYVLFNCNSIESYIEEHKAKVDYENPRLSRKNIEQIHSNTFANWFYKHVENLHLVGNQVSEELRALARGPNPVGKRYRGFIVNGFRFHVKSCEIRKKTQNSGLVVTAQTSSFASRNDNNPIIGDFTYYGILKDIIELEYFGGRKIVMFDCDWVSVRSAQKRDEYGFTLVNLSRLRQHSEPFILASQAQQVFYVEDHVEKGWNVVVKTKARDTFDMDPVLSLDADAIQQNDTNDAQFDDEDEQLNLVREDVEGTVV